MATGKPVVGANAKALLLLLLVHDIENTLAAFEELYEHVLSSHKGTEARADAPVPAGVGRAE